MGKSGTSVAPRADEEVAAPPMLDKGLTIFRIRGIPVRLHVSLLVFLPYVAFVATRQIDAVASALGIPRQDFHLPPPVWGVILAVGLFVSVLIH